MFDVINLLFPISLQGRSINATATLSNEEDRENARRVVHEKNR
jgi:hypothetical protein